MKATYEIFEQVGNAWVPAYCYGIITLYHPDLEEELITTKDSKTPRGARGRVKRVMESMGILDYDEVKVYGGPSDPYICWKEGE